MKGWNRNTVDYLPYSKHAGHVEPYGEPDMANENVRFDPTSFTMVTHPAPRPDLDDFNPVKISRPRNAAAGTRWEIWCGRVRLYMITWPLYEQAMVEMERLADTNGHHMRTLRLVRAPCDADFGPRVAVRRGADEVAQLTSRVRSLLLRETSTGTQPSLG